MPLDTSLPIGGKVTDSDGTARAGAEVRVYRLDTEDTNNDGEPDNITGSAPLARQQTDSNGNFSFSDSLPVTLGTDEYVAVVAHGLDSGSGEPLDNGRFPILDATNESNATIYTTAYSKELDNAPDNATFRVSLLEESGYSDGDTITSLTDQIGSKDLTDGPGLTYDADGINGNPAARGNGVDQYLRRTSWGIDRDLPVTVSGVFQRNSTTGFGIHVGWESGVSGKVSCAVYPDRDDVSNTFDIYSGQALNDGGSDNNAHAYVAVFDGANSVFNVDGTEYTGGSGGRAIGANEEMAIGANPDGSQNYLDGWNGEVVLTPERLDSSQRAEEINRLQELWGI